MHAFTYSVSHDLRAPLRHIDGFIELLQRKTETVIDEQGRHYMAAISEAAQKMGLLIDDLLSFSRMGRHAVTVQQVDLSRLVRDILREFEPDSAGRNIDWRIGDLPMVSGDKVMLRAVLVNLISNALKFTRTRGQAQIEIGSLPGQDAETVIFVRDNGVGFDMTYADKLFGVFQRLHSAEEFEGTGIGLANVRRNIARHGGRTWAEGEVDQGAFPFHYRILSKGIAMNKSLKFISSCIGYCMELEIAGILFLLYSCHIKQLRSAVPACRWLVRIEPDAAGKIIARRISDLPVVGGDAAMLQLCWTT